MAEQVRTLMAEIGGHLDLGEVRAFEEESAWTLAPEEDLVVIATHDADLATMTFEAALGGPSPDRRPVLAEQILLFNAHWRETGGERIGLTEPGGSFVLLFSFPVAGLGLHQLGNLFQNFVVKVRLWRDIMAGPSDRDELPADDMSGFVRI